MERAIVWIRHHHTSAPYLRMPNISRPSLGHSSVLLCNQHAKGRLQLLRRLQQIKFVTWQQDLEAQLNLLARKDL